MERFFYTNTCFENQPDPFAQLCHERRVVLLHDIDRVAEHFSHIVRAGTSGQQVNRKGVPETVWMGVRYTGVGSTVSPAT